MKLTHFLVVFSFCIMIATGCETKILPPADFGYNYIPIDTGRYYIYQVDSIRINLTASPYQFDTFHYEMKEFYPYTFLNANNDTVTCCTRYYRTSDSLPWTPIGSNVWWINRTTTRFEKTEENLTYVRMTYPVDENTVWNGNVYNILNPKNYHYGTPDVNFYDDVNHGIFDVNFHDGPLLFDSTITVTQGDPSDTNQISYIMTFETYRRNIGMVYKANYNIPQLITNNNQWAPWPFAVDWPLVPKLKRIRNGSIVIYKLSEYGFE